jgi:membrane-associated phospholipid phosphatase
MQSGQNEFRQLQRPSEPEPRKLSGMARSISSEELVAALRQRALAASVGLHATLVLAVASYALALGGTLVLGIKAPVLDAVPFFLGAAAFVCLYGRLAFPRTDRMTLAVAAGCIIVALGLSLACLSYLGAMMDFPLRDQQMISIDRALGFDWLRVMVVLDRWPHLLDLLGGAYASFAAQLIGTVLVLVIAKRVRDLDLFFLTFVCASVISEIASVLVPTLGPMSALGAHASFANLPTLGRTTADIVLSLRGGSLNVIDLEAIDGIISFPSLHAAVAVIVPLSLRWNKPLLWPVLGLDTVMFFSAVPSGNHYFADVLGGVAVAVLAVICARRIQRALETHPSGASG